MARRWGGKPDIFGQSTGSPRPSGRSRVASWNPLPHLVGPIGHHGTRCRVGWPCCATWDTRKLRQIDQLAQHGTPGNRDRCIRSRSTQTATDASDRASWRNEACVRSAERCVTTNRRSGHRRPASRSPFVVPVPVTDGRSTDPPKRQCIGPEISIEATPAATRNTIASKNGVS